MTWTKNAASTRKLGSVFVITLVINVFSARYAMTVTTAGRTIESLQRKSQPADPGPTSSWIDIGVPSWSNKRSQVRSIKDYGAVCDGATDDTNAVAAALTAAGTSGTVVVPCLSLITAIAIPPGVTLTGVGWNSGLKEKASPQNKVMITMGPKSALRNMLVDGGATDSRLALLAGANDALIDRVYFKNTTNNAVQLYQSFRVKVTNSTFDNCGHPGGLGGAVLLNSGTINGADKVSDNTIDFSTFVNGPGHGIVLIDGAYRNKITRSVFKANGQNAIELDRTSRYNLVSANTIDSYLDGIDILHNSEYNVVTGNVIKSERTDGIAISTGNYNKITRNIIKQAGARGILLTANSNGNIVAANRIFNPSRSTRNTYAGIDVASGDDNEILRNQIFDNQATPTMMNGISIGAGVNRTHYAANKIRRAVISSIADAGTASVCVAQRECR